MKKLQKLVGCILAIALLAGSMAACAPAEATVPDTGSGQKASTQPAQSTVDQSGGNKTTDIQPEEDKPDFSNDVAITITLMTNDYISAPINSDQLVLAELAARTKVKIEFQVIPSADYGSKLTLLIGSGKLPDLMNVWTPDFVSKYLGDGVFAKLNDLIDTYGKSIMKELDSIPGSLKNLKDDEGDIYFLPRIDTSGLNTQVIINNAFLEKLNLPVPTTVDDYYNTLKAFKTLGKDVIPLGGGFATSLEQPIFNGFRTSFSSRWYYNDGEYVYAPYMQRDRVKSALQMLARMYSEGLIDKEYYALSEDDKLNKMLSGKLGAFNSWQDGIGGWTKGNEDNPELDYVPVYPLSSSYGEGIQGRREPLAGYYAISAKSKYADRIVKMYNYMCTDEGKELMNWGIAGNTFTVENGKRVYTDVVMEHEEGPINGRRYLGIDQVDFPNIMDWDSWAQSVDDFLPGIMEKCVPYYLPSQPNLIPTAEESDKLAQIMTDIDKLVTTSYQQFIVGDLNFGGDWDNFIAQMEKMGIQEAIDIKLGIFERWESR